MLQVCCGHNGIVFVAPRLYCFHNVLLINALRVFYIGFITANIELTRFTHALSFTRPHVVPNPSDFISLRK